jgi:hypothetical protein
MVEKPISSFGVNLASAHGLVKKHLLQHVNARRTHPGNTPGNQGKDAARSWYFRRANSPEALW